MLGDWIKSNILE